MTEKVVELTSMVEGQFDELSLGERREFLGYFYKKLKRHNPNKRQAIYQWLRSRGIQCKIFFSERIYIDGFFKGQFYFQFSKSEGDKTENFELFENVKLFIKYENGNLSELNTNKFVKAVETGEIEKLK